MALGGFPDWFFGVFWPILADPAPGGPGPVSGGPGAVPGRFWAGPGRSDGVRPARDRPGPARDRPGPPGTAPVPAGSGRPTPARKPRRSSGDRRRGKRLMMIAGVSDHHRPAPSMNRSSIVHRSSIDSGMSFDHRCQHRRSTDQSGLPSVIEDRSTSSMIVR